MAFIPASAMFGPEVLKGAYQVAKSAAPGASAAAGQLQQQAESRQRTQQQIQGVMDSVGNYAKDLSNRFQASVRAFRDYGQKAAPTTNDPNSGAPAPPAPESGPAADPQPPPQDQGPAQPEAPPAGQQYLAVERFGAARQGRGQQMQTRRSGRHAGRPRKPRLVIPMGAKGPRESKHSGFKGLPPHLIRSGFGQRRSDDPPQQTAGTERPGMYQKVVTKLLGAGVRAAGGALGQIAAKGIGGMAGAGQSGPMDLNMSATGGPQAKPGTTPPTAGQPPTPAGPAQPSGPMGPPKPRAYGRIFDQNGEVDVKHMMTKGKGGPLQYKKPGAPEVDYYDEPAPGTAGQKPQGRIVDHVGEVDMKKLNQPNSQLSYTKMHGESAGPPKPAPEPAPKPKPDPMQRSIPVPGRTNGGTMMA